MFICRCFSDLQCDGYSFTMWLKLLVIDTTQKHIFSSEYITLVMVRHVLRFNIKHANQGKTWKADTGMTGRINVWMHVAGTWKCCTAARLYIDGTLNATDLGTDESVAISSMPNRMHIGKKYSVNEKYGQFLLDEWYFWDRELSGDLVAQVYAVYETGTNIIQYECSRNIM